MSITLYGIANCDTVKKAKTWLQQQGVEYSFHDYRKQGLDADQLTAWVDELGWEALLNRRGTTWRKLDESVRDAVDRDSAIQIMLDNPAIIKRPLLDRDGKKLLGFDADAYQEIAKQP